jgi:hypothetical protein
MSYLPGESKVIYCSKDGKQEKVFDALEWLAGHKPADDGDDISGQVKSKLTDNLLEIHGSGRAS